MEAKDKLHEEMEEFRSQHPALKDLKNDELLQASIIMVKYANRGEIVLSSEQREQLAKLFLER